MKKELIVILAASSLAVGGALAGFGLQGRTAHGQHQHVDGSSGHLDGSSSHVGGSSSLAHADYVTADSLKKLSEAPIIVIGTVQGIAGTRNMARDPNDASKEDPQYVIEGVDYRVKIDKYLQGTGPTEIRVTQRKSVLNTTRTKTPTLFEGFKDLPSGGRYMMFIRQTKDGSGSYVGIAEPWRFQLQGGKARVESQWEYAATTFPEMGEAEFLDQVQAVVGKIQ